MSAEQLSRPSTEPRPAIIYCRVSGAKQATDGHGLESQERDAASMPRGRATTSRRSFPTMCPAAVTL